MNQDSPGIILVAFDGMDYKLIQEYGLENITQQEFGRIDNNTDVCSRYTSELFASLITGESHERHGIKKLMRTDRFWPARHGLVPSYLSRNIRGFWPLKHGLKSLSKKLIRAEKRNLNHKYDRTDLRCRTLFDRVECAKPPFVPSYNPDPRWQVGLPHKISEIDTEKVRKYTEKLTESRLNDFWDLSFEFWDLVMLHLHDPDPMQDLGLGSYMQDYERLDSIAADIAQNFSDDRTIIFLSDHGRMEHAEHNKQAFYSCNKELFRDKTPHITDFHDKILELS